MFKKNKSLHRSSKSCSVLRSGFVDSIRTRNQSSWTIKPQLAVSVLNNYILPKLRLSKKVSVNQSLKKLITATKKRITAKKNDLITVQKKTSELQKVTFAIQNNLETEKTALKLLVGKPTNKTQHSLNFNYKHKFHHTQQLNSSLVKSLQEQRGFGKALETKAIRESHYSKELEIENAVSGEQLRGLYQSLKKPQNSPKLKEDKTPITQPCTPMPESFKPLSFTNATHKFN